MNDPNHNQPWAIVIFDGENIRALSHIGPSDRRHLEGISVHRAFIFGNPPREIRETVAHRAFPVKGTIEKIEFTTTIK